MLAELVAQGALPPVEERLPENPGVSPVMESIGRYGGTMRRGFNGVSDAAGPAPLAATTLVWFNAEGLTLRPTLAESWETNEDASVWTYHLRPGAKWSDGTPFTTEAFTWFWEQEQKNRELTPKPTLRLSTGTPSVFAELETPDDYTAIIQFAHPNPLFASEFTRFSPLNCGHYMQQFHAAFVPKEELDRKVAAAGVASWTDLYFDRNAWQLNPDRPSLGVFVLKGVMSEELFVMERNPYYSQVDSEGNQLPYLDRVTHRLFSTRDVFNMWVVNGEIDFSARHVEIADYTLFKMNETQGSYRTLTGPRDWHLTMFPNQTALDPRIRELFADRRVRLAMSYAMNRDEINEIVFDGMATPRQHSPNEESPQHYPKLSNAHLAYDPDRANALLDEAGYSARNAEGFRVWKDGSGDAIFFTFEDDGRTPAGVDAMAMAVAYLADVGINCAHKVIERGLWGEHVAANLLEAGSGLSSRCLLPFIEPEEFRGIQVDRPWCPAYTRWRLDPTAAIAEEPPADHFLWRVWSIWDELAAEPDEARRNELFFSILDIWAEELPVVSLLGQLPALCIVKNGFRNYLEGFPVVNTTRQEFLQGVETYFWDDPDSHA